jgi:spore germination protein KB
MFLYQLGTTVIFGFASGAKQDAWLATCIGTVLGTSLIFIFTKLYEWFPEQNWVSLLNSTFGRHLGNVIALLYILAFIYEGGRILRDLGELINTFLLPRTPIMIPMFLIVVLVCYACYAGVERMGRLAELCIIFVVLSIFAQITFLIFSNVFHISWITPIASDWKNIGVSVFPVGISTTFGETIVFAMFWTLTVRPTNYRKAALLSSISAGIVIVLLDFMAIGALGADMFSRALYPLLSTFQLISLAEFIDNMDPGVVTNFITCGLFKVLLYTYAACAGVTAQWKVENLRSVIIPVSAIVFIIGIYTAKNISSHIFVGLKWVPWVIELPLFILLPLFAFVIVAIKKKISA